MVQQAFDFRWSRVSIIWTTCAVFAILLVHLGAFLMKTNGAYKEAIKAIESDSLILSQTGKIISFSYFVTGTFQSTGESNFMIGVIGKKKGINVEASVYGDGESYSINQLEVFD